MEAEDFSETLTDTSETECHKTVIITGLPNSGWILYSPALFSGALVAQWLRCCATNRKVAGSIPAVVIGFFIDIKSFRSHYGPGVDSGSNRDENQEYFVGVKAAGA